MAVCLGRPVEQVCNQKETMWYENHVVRFRVQWESRVERGIRSQSEALGRLWQYGLQRGASIGTPGSRKKSPLWVYVSLSICQTYNKLGALFENKMREIYFYKEMCFVHSLKFVHYLQLCSWLGLWEVYNILISKIFRWFGSGYQYGNGILIQRLNISAYLNCSTKLPWLLLSKFQ